ncbi:hypothetical protein ASF23_05710 [Curtobacterium sp. Leaf261]|nr:hypothetical protein ASF23_05710 [Curtobacterium sp. Leaf261]
MLDGSSPAGLSGPDAERFDPLHVYHEWMRTRAAATGPSRLAEPGLPSVSEADETLFGSYRRAVLTDLGTDFRLGFKLAYFANFASPAIAAPLDASSEIARQPMRRAKDTSIVVYEILTNGFDSERGARMVDLLRRVHRGVPGSADDYRYVLLTLLVIPVRMVDRSGPRRLTDRERADAARFHSRLGAEIGLDDAEVTYAEAVAFCRRYEREHLRRSAAGDRLTASTLGALLASVPAALRPLADVVARFGLSALLGDPRMARALGFPVVPVPVARVVAALRRAGRRRGRDGLEARIAFTSGEPSRTYPAGYRLDEIGPGADR